ncbi:MAG: TonB-dependent receptor plug domain-containing protein, partial [Niabella sp.]
MPTIIDYILKLNICLSVVYIFYQLFLRRLTFYNWNRWYLLGYTVLSFIIPLIDIMPSLQKRDLQQAAVMEWIPMIGFAKDNEPGFFETLTYWDWAIAVMLLVSLILSARFAIRFYAFKKMKAKAQLISSDQTCIYQLNDPVTPFSFGNAIFINTDMHSGEELEEIIRHEFVHVKQKHTLDIIWCELLCILNWFNPFMWLIRYNVRQNLEFIADNKVLQNGFDKKEYQYLLLKVMGNRQFAFTNHFNFSSLKKRIAMMNTIKSAKIHLIKFMFLLPVVAVLLLSFRKELHKSEAKISINRQQDSRAKDTLPENNHNVIELVSGDTLIVSNSGKTTVSGRPVIKLHKVNGSINNDPLLVVDGTEMPQAFDINNLAPGDIQSIEILKDASAVSEYGEKGKNGVVNIKTKIAGKPVLRLRASDVSGGAKPLYVVDGVPVENGDLGRLNPDDIASISVVKDSASRSVYGPKAGAGVIFVTTKPEKPANDAMTFTAKGNKVYVRAATKDVFSE